MPGALSIVPVLADNNEAAIAIVVALISIVSWIVNLVSNKNNKVPPAANRPRPPVRPRDERLQQEINIFIMDAGKSGSKTNSPARPAAPKAKQVASGSAGKSRPTVAAPPKKQPRRSRPGEDIAKRQAPVTETLGAAVKQHLSQRMTERVEQETQQRLGSRVADTVEQDLGPTTPSGSRSSRPMPAPPPELPPGRAAGFADLLRNPATLKQAIILNLILSPPVALKRTPRP